MLRLKKACLMTGLFLFIGMLAICQNQQRADSLIRVYKSGDYPKGEVLAIFKAIAENETNLDKKLEYSELLISTATQNSNLKMVYSGYLQKGNALQLKGDYAEALKSYLNSLEIANEIEDENGAGVLMISIADTYSMAGNYSTSQEYYKKGIDHLRTTNDSVSLASALLNAGDGAFNNKDYELALRYFEESGKIFKKVNYPLGTAYNLGNVGMVYAEQGKDEQAKKKINEAVELLEELGAYYPISVFLRYMSDIYARQQNLPEAFMYAERSLDLALKNGLKDQISESNLLLSDLHMKARNYEEAYNYYKSHIAYRDSIENLETVQQMADLRTNYEVSKKAAEVDLLKQQQKTQRITVIGTVVALVLLGLLAIGLYRRNQFINRTRSIIEKEKNRSESLLLNILPEETAHELKDYGKVRSKRFESVSVLFTDFKDFTRYSESSRPEDLVKSVDFYFSSFDDIIDKYGLEKIKTVGDAYMVAGGLPFPTSDHALKVVMAAIEIIEFVTKTKEDKDSDHIKFDIRIGINSGPVVAGVVGKKKFAYDIWGDTVNIAARMESNSEIGQINISENTFRLIQDHCNCDYRGEIQVKNKGKMKMYYVKDFRKDVKSINTMENIPVPLRSIPEK